MVNNRTQGFQDGYLQKTALRVQEILQKLKGGAARGASSAARGAISVGRGVKDRYNRASDPDPGGSIDYGSHPSVPGTRKAIGAGRLRDHIARSVQPSAGPERSLDTYSILDKMRTELSVPNRREQHRLNNPVPAPPKPAPPAPPEHPALRSDWKVPTYPSRPIQVDTGAGKNARHWLESQATDGKPSNSL